MDSSQPVGKRAAPGADEFRLETKAAKTEGSFGNTGRHVVDIEQPGTPPAAAPAGQGMMISRPQVRLTRRQAAHRRLAFACSLLGGAAAQGAVMGLSADVVELVGRFVTAPKISSSIAAIVEAGDVTASEWSQLHPGSKTALTNRKPDADEIEADFLGLLASAEDGTLLRRLLRLVNSEPAVGTDSLDYADWEQQNEHTRRLTEFATNVYLATPAVTEHLDRTTAAAEALVR